MSLSVTFLLGRSGSGKTERMLEEVMKELNERPLGPPILIIVPDQMTFQIEYELAKRLPAGGMIRAQVYSFSRLAWRVLQETGGLTRLPIDTTGISMLIRKILNERKNELRLFQSQGDKIGFIEKLGDLLTELKRYCVKPEELRQLQNELEHQKERSTLSDKLNDLPLVLQAFQERLEGKYLDQEDSLRLLAEQLPVSHFLNGATVFVDGFYSFTPQEYEVIASLMNCSVHIHFLLTLDRTYRYELPNELDLFRMTGETYATLYQIAKDAGMHCEDEILENQYRSHISLNHLEQELISMPPAPFLEDTALTMAEAANRRAEVEGIAQTIHKLVREEDYRFRDIAILVRNGAAYDELLDTIFKQYQIPYFKDQKRKMIHHPVIELVRSVLEVIQQNWRYEPMFRAIKTELLYPREADAAAFRADADLLENYCLAYGIKGKQWISRDRWKYRRYKGLEWTDLPQTDEEKRMEAKINELRIIVSAPINRLAYRLKRAGHVREQAEALYLFLEELEIPAKLEKWIQEAEESGQLERAREHDQVWDAVIRLLDQAVELLGDEVLSLKQFAEIIESGFNALTYSIVPQSLDQVLIANIDQSRIHHGKAAFIIGLNDGVLPQKQTDDGIIADEERLLMKNAGIPLAPSSETRLLDEDFIAYKAFTTPMEKLFISYPIADEEGKSLLASPWIKRLKELFPTMERLTWGLEPSGEQEKQFALIPDVALSHLTSQLQLYKKGNPISDFWWDVYNALMEIPSLKTTTAKVLSSLFFENKTKALSKKITKELYGDVIQASVSRMEKFNSCPFSHFISHGLRLEPRPIYKLDAPNIGELFHGALKLLAERLEASNRSWASLSKKDCEQLSRDVVELLAPKLQNQILLSSNRHHYIRHKLEQVIAKTSYALSKQAKASRFVPAGLEIGFGKNGKLPPLTFSLDDGTKMELAGRIDRVDTASFNGGTYVRVVDYKSSKKELQLSDIYYGLSLQMLTYLDLVVTHSKDWLGAKAEPAGVLYFHIHNPFLQANEPLEEDQIETELLKQYKMLGLLLSDPDVVKLMDQSLESGTSSIVSAGLKKDGSFNAYSKIATKDEFDVLRRYVRKTFKKAGNQMVEGRIDIAPYKLRNQTPCAFCSYKSICQFDSSLQENAFRYLQPAKAETAIDWIRREAEVNE
ncbi:helicase-exonuclease AddAB subunit AddB [Bacillus litorisediminis]|uniref:helicase-exonuclease AddAB subunit AddB n=1 Tax=Bacillus litorisediminis TaxID=2922713 RepID=UPI001FAF6168|nr:helicase-exonuclease AddAB subunit AddB [Bacillus litorisediminis]